MSYSNPPASRLTPLSYNASTPAIEQGWLPKLLAAGPKGGDTQTAVMGAERFKPDPAMVNRLKAAIGGIGRNVLGPGVENAVPVDHFQTTRDGEGVATTVTLRGEDEAIGRYSAPSKLGVYISTLFHLAQGNPILEELGITPTEARQLMADALRAYRAFQQDPDKTHSKAGCISWY